MSKDEEYMHQTLLLARKGAEKVSPNPMVGCLIVKGERVIGEGWHQEYGKAHAERNAVDSVEDKHELEGSVAYVNLEPCSHFGKTPPCCDLLIDAKVRKVVIANVDPNPLVNGKGIRRMQDAGIEVVTGVLDKEARELNHAFFLRMEKKKDIPTVNHH